MAKPLNVGAAAFTVHVNGEGVLVRNERRLDFNRGFARDAEQRMITRAVLEAMMIPKFKRMFRRSEKILRQIHERRTNRREDSRPLVPHAWALITWLISDSAEEPRQIDLAEPPLVDQLLQADDLGLEA